MLVYISILGARKDIDLFVSLCPRRSLFTWEYLVDGFPSNRNWQSLALRQVMLRLEPRCQSNPYPHRLSMIVQVDFSQTFIEGTLPSELGSLKSLSKSFVTYMSYSCFEWFSQWIPHNFGSIFQRSRQYDFWLRAARDTAVVQSPWVMLVFRLSVVVSWLLWFQQCVWRLGLFSVFNTHLNGTIIFNLTAMPELGKALS